MKRRRQLTSSGSGRQQQDDNKPPWLLPQPRRPIRITAAAVASVIGLLLGILTAKYKQQIALYRQERMALAVSSQEEPRHRLSGVQERRMKESSSPVQQQDNEHSTAMTTTVSDWEKGLSQSALNQWCPEAKCRVSSLCHPCKRRYLIVAATGRSASTTLQWMLDSLPGVRVGGENRNALSNVKELFKVLRRNRNWRNESMPSWKRERYPYSAWACVAQQFMETINPPPNKNGIHLANDDDASTIVGFKTIRLQKKEEDKPLLNVARLLKRTQFLQRMLPCARVIVNIRSDVNAQAASQSKNLNKHGVNLTYENEMLTKMARQLGPQRAHILDSSEWTRNITVLNQAVSWLGFDEACHFDKPFELNVNGYEIGENSRVNKPGCVALPA